MIGKMSNIQDIRAFEERIYDIVQEYVDGLYNENDVLAIDAVNHVLGKTHIEASVVVESR